MNNSNVCVISGLYRSGTTYLQKLLDNSSRISVLNHGTYPIFKFIKNLYYENMKLSSSDNLLGINQISYDLDILSNLNINKDKYQIMLQSLYADCKDDVKRGGQSSHPTTKWPATFDSFDIEKIMNVKCLLYYIFLSVSKYKNIINTQEYLIGIKELNLEEFFPLIYKHYHELKFIQIIRDPRAIVSSRNFSNQFLNTRGGGKKHSLLAITKVWKNSIKYRNKFTNLYPKAFMSVFYEDIVLDHKKTLKSISSFINREIDLKQNLLRDDKGDIWKNNSSFKSPCHLNYTNKWRNVLDSNTTAVIELLCRDEFMSLGYEFVHSLDFQLKAFKEYKEDTSTLSKWNIDHKLFLSEDYKKDFLNDFEN